MIAAYLDKLASALAFDPALAARVVIEAGEHLADAAAEDACIDRDEAERRAVARFGDPRELAAQFAAVSLARQSWRIGVIIVLAIVVAMAMMKARLVWYALVQWTIADDARAAAAIVLSVNRYAFWVAVLIGLGALFHVGRRTAPARLHTEYRSHLRRATLLFSAATVALAVSVAGDLILMGLRVKLTLDSIIPIASVAVEIGSVAFLIVMITRASRLMTRTAGALGV
jgi:hypothetical protein